MSIDEGKVFVDIGVIVLAVALPIALMIETVRWYFRPESRRLRRIAKLRTMGIPRARALPRSRPR